MTRNDYVFPAAIGLLVVAAVVGVISFGNSRAAKLDTAMLEYERCVVLEYKTTPAAFYQEHGHYPECVSRNVRFEDGSSRVMTPSEWALWNS